MPEPYKIFLSSWFYSSIFKSGELLCKNNKKDDVPLKLEMSIPKSGSAAAFCSLKINKQA